jgi:hypothetical protein
LMRSNPMDKSRTNSVLLVLLERSERFRAHARPGARREVQVVPGGAWRVTPGRPRARGFRNYPGLGGSASPWGSAGRSGPGSGRPATRAPAAPARAAPPAEATTSHRVTRGSSRQDARLAATSSASDRAPAATQARADPASAAGPCRAASAPSPRARSRAPSARPNTRAATSSAAAPTHGLAGTAGQARAVTPSATRPAATAVAPRRSSDGISVEVNCTLLPGPPSSATRLMDDPDVGFPVLAEVPDAVPEFGPFA